MHHVENSEHALAEITGALRPKGQFVLLEYTGPARFQLDYRVQLLMDRLLSILPESYRRSIKEPGLTKDHVDLPAHPRVDQLSGGLWVKITKAPPV